MIYLELFLTFLQIGAVSFGGGYGMISLIRENVLMHGWLTEEELLNMIAVSESTPGPIAVNMATFVGSSEGGALGSLVATLGVVLPSFIIILIIAALVQVVESVLKKYMPPLYNSLGVYLPLITTNCAVLGVTILNFTKELNYGEAIVNSLGAGLGFLLAMVLFAGVRSRLEQCDIPKALRGLPITLIAASLVALSFLGFGGVANHLF